MSQLDLGDLGQLVYKTIDLYNSSKSRTFTVPPRSIIGPGGSARTGEALASLNIQKVLIIIDDFLADQNLADAMIRSLDSYGIEHHLFRQFAKEPDIAIVDEMTQAIIQGNCPAVIAFGGGSILDAAKAAAVLAANPHLSLRDMAKDPKRITQKRPPFIAVPTTAGTGSEATVATVITDAEEKVKLLIVHDDMIPDLAIIDACLTLGTPSNFTAAVGVDTLTHAVEAYVATNATPLTKALAYRAITLVGESLAIAVGQGKNVEARESMMLASYMAGISFSNAGLGLCHAMAHQLGPIYGVPHGVANAILLPSVMYFNQMVCRKGYAEIGLALSGKLLDSEQTIVYIQKLIAELGLPTNLQEVGGRDEHFESFAESALRDVSIDTNPRTASKPQVIATYHHAQLRQIPS